MPETSFELIGAILLGVALGAAIGWMAARQRSIVTISEATARAEAVSTANEEARSNAKEEYSSLASLALQESLNKNSEHFLNLVGERLKSEQKSSEMDLKARKKEIEAMIEPMREQMQQLSKSNQDIEKSRVGAYEGIKRQLKQLEEQAERLGTRTNALSTALTTSSQARGNWGEVKLRRLFEMAGMTEHVDFFEQETVADGGRPDFIVRLPGQGALPVDSKATGEHYLRAVELEPGPEQNALLESHSKALKGRIKELSSKAYQDSIEGEFDHVIMFVPSEAMAAAAFSVDPGLMDYAMTKAVLVTTPVTMLGLLRTVALYWQQHSLAEDAKEIYDVSKEMYRRVATFFDHVQKVGGHLEKAGKSYNDAMNSYSTRILPQGRRLEEMKVSETLPKTLPETKMVETVPLHNDSEE